MSLLQPFRAFRPIKTHAEAIIAPPYDVLNSEEAREMAKEAPLSFLHVSKPEIDLAKGTDAYSEEVYQTGKTNYLRLIEQGLLAQDEMPSFYLYALTMGTHRQIGIVAAASVAAYDANRIKKHEYTRPKKENDRVKHIETLEAQTGPVLLTYRHSDEIDALVSEVASAAPLIDVTDNAGVVHQVWVIDDQEEVAFLEAAFERVGELYIADGHHRSAAASRVALSHREAGVSAAHPSQSFLSVTFPDNQVNILDYNRVVTDLNGHSSDDFLQALTNSFEVETCDKAVKPSSEYEFGMYLGSTWFRLTLKSPESVSSDPVASLSVSLLAEKVIEPLLGIGDPRTDERIDFVGGIRGLKALEKRVDSGEMAVAFSVYPTTLEALFAVADDNQVMPPKSTWFEPKLADGLFVLHIGP